MFSILNRVFSKDEELCGVSNILVHRKPSLRDLDKIIVDLKTLETSILREIEEYVASCQKEKLRKIYISYVLFFGSPIIFMFIKSIVLIIIFLLNVFIFFLIIICLTECNKT